jgi:hypothetical protein
MKCTLRGVIAVTERAEGGREKAGPKIAQTLGGGFGKGKESNSPNIGVSMHFHRFDLHN